MSEWKCELIEALEKQRQAILANSSLLLEEAEQINARLVAIGEPANANTWAKFTSALQLVVQAVAGGSVDTSVLKSATDKFEALSKSSTPNVAVLGFYGLSVSSLLLHEDLRSAVIVYRTSEEYPAVSIQTFSPEFYSDPFREIISRNYDRVERNVRQYRELASANRAKRGKYLLTVTFRNLIVSPINYILSILTAAGILKAAERAPGHHQRKNQSKTMAAYSARMRAFDQAAETSGWALGRAESLKEHQLLDQVNRNTVIYKSQLVSIVQDSKAKRRELEAKTK